MTFTVGYCLNRLDEPIFMAGLKPLLTDFGIHHRLESRENEMEKLTIPQQSFPKSATRCKLETPFFNLKTILSKRISFRVRTGECPDGATRKRLLTCVPLGQALQISRADPTI